MMIGVIESIGAVAFFLSVLWGIHNVRNEVNVTEFWTVYTIAAITGFFFTGLKAVEWFGGVPVAADALQSPVGVMFATVLLITAVVCVVSPVKRQVK